MTNKSMFPKLPLLEKTYSKQLIIFLVLWIILAVSAYAIAADNMGGSYKKKQDGHRISMYIEPTGGDEKVAG